MKITNPVTAMVASLPWTMDFVWQGTSGVTRLDDDRRAIVSCGYFIVGRIDSFDVRIVSKTSGEIVRKSFGFRDYLDDIEVKGDQSYRHTYFIDSREGLWHQDSNLRRQPPKNAEAITDAVELWIGEWT